MKASDNLEGLEVKAGILEHRMIKLDQVKALAVLPSKEELIARVVGSIRAPLAGLVNVCQGNQRALLTVLNQIKQ